jgi:polysaccharide biosynthesis transport protein
MTESYQLTLRDYLAMARRRAWIIGAIFSLVLAIGLTVTMLIPPTYESTGTIVIESQQVPTDLVQATVTSFADERIEIIKQRVMTRENLLRIIEKHQLFKGPEYEGSKITPSDMIDQMRQRIGVILVNANVQNRGGRAASGTIAFKVSFEHRRPDVAQRVANELVTLFLDENVKVRTERATQTTVFLSQEATKLKTELETLEAQIAGYKVENGNSLPDNAPMTATAIQRLESDLRSLEAEGRSANEEIRAFELELAGAKAGLGTSSQTRTPEQELSAAKAELARLAALYTDNHPDVRAAKRKVEGLDRSAGTNSPSGSGVQTTADLQVARIENRIAAARNRIALINQQQSAIRHRIGMAEQQLMKAPQVERGLAALTRDYQNAQKKYDEIRAKQMTAQVAENLEDDQKAERFTLLEPPLFPDKPIKPNRSKMGAMSLFVALVAALGVVFVLETIHGTVRGADALALVVGQRPLVSIPYIEVEEEVVKRNKFLKLGVIGGAVGLVVSLVVVHILVMPLDLVLYKLLNRLG